ncbi:MAG: HipA domain-containing protein [Eubacteriales bacterium]|nr:HipA domain-containing protein [Eubacteriales bacterium]
MRYYLMHKEVQAAEIELDELANLIAVENILHEEHLPFGTCGKDGVDKKKLARWWATRAIPASRSGLRHALEQLDMSVSQELLDKCYGLSLSDQYWINPLDHPLQWKDINFFEHSFSDDVGNLLFGKTYDSEQISLVSPDNTSDGQLLKKWKIQEGKRVLLKGSSAPYYQEAYNEVIASRIAAALHIPHVEYELYYEAGQAYSACRDFITSEQDLISANHFLQAFQKPNHLSMYEFYISCGETIGIDDIRQRMEEMLVLDYLIANTDRHFNNFGLVREAETLQWIGTAPIFDCGTSLWHSVQTAKIKALAPRTPSKPFKETHGEQIKLVKDLSWIDFAALEDIPEYAENVLLDAEEISDSRRRIIVEGLRQRIYALEESIL